MLLKKIFEWIAKMFAIVTVAGGQLFDASCIYTYSVRILFR